MPRTADLALPDGRQRVVRHGHDPVRTIQTGIGPVKVQKPKARDRGAPERGERIRFTSSILPKWARRTKSLDALLPALYLRGISAGDFQEVLTALLGKDAPNLSPAVIARLKGEWEDEYQRWQKRDLSARRYVYVWADGVYLQARMEPQAECMLVLIGATPEGKKELIGFQTGMRESAQSWKELLVDLKARGLSIAPEVAVGDGALGFWKALDETFPATRHQRCWLHKTLNVLDKFPKSMQPNAHKDLREIWLAPDRATAETAIATFAEKYAPKYDKAVECLIKDRETLLTFFDFPADHWDHLRTTNPIESVFATVRHRSLQAPWPDEAVLQKICDLVLPGIERQGRIEAWIVDDTGFTKKGTHSVGVARQYCGRLGKQDNCQVAVTLSIAESFGEPADRLPALSAGDMGT